jgi:hypothetical protein
MIPAIEKAEEFVDEMRLNWGCNECHNGWAEECALVGVERIIYILKNEIKDIDVRGNVLFDLIKYYEEVKIESQKIVNATYGEW